MKRFALALAAASLLVACSSDDSPNCDPEFYDCTPTDNGGDGNGGNNGGGNNGGNGGDDTPPRNHPTYTQDELRELGVIFPGDEGWSAGTIGSSSTIIDAERPWENVSSLGNFGQINTDEDSIQAFWDEHVAAVYACNPLKIHPNAILLHFQPTSSESETDLTLIGLADDFVCIQTPFGAGIWNVEGVRQMVARVDDSFMLLDDSPASTCHPTIDGIAFTRNNVNTELAYPNAYTVGSIHDALVPVSDCRP